jgi:hypothetical protein
MAGVVPPALPEPVGPLSSFVHDTLRDEPTFAHPRVLPEREPLDDLDLQLALYCCYELHYRGFRGVDDRHEWNPRLLEFRRDLEQCFESSLRDIVGPIGHLADPCGELVAAIDECDGPSLSSYVEKSGSLDELREFAVHRSAYQLKEADPHTWAIPRLEGEAKAALVHIQADEYGFGRTADMHSSLFAETMRRLGLDDRYGAYLPTLPASTLATVNLVTMFGLHRRLRAAAVGHLAVFEMTSVVPMQRYANALRRFGIGPEAERFYDVHVVADADHEVVALERMVAGLVAAEPDLAPEVLFGARAVLNVEERFATALLSAWACGTTALRSEASLPA